MSNLLTSNITAMGLLTPSLTPASVGANTSAEQTFAVQGLQVGDFVEMNAPGLTAGTGIVNARVSAANTLAIAFSNGTGGSLTPAAGVYQMLWMRTDASRVSA